MAEPARPSSWRVHPAAERPLAAGGAAAVILAAAAGAHLFMGHAVWSWVAAGLAALLLTASLQRFFFPGRFELDERGITARWLMSSQFIPWSEVRRFVRDERGAFLSRRLRPSRLDGLGRHGMHILLPRDPEARAPIVALIDRQMHAAAMANGTMAIPSAPRGAAV
jgi:hypothetical protein